MAVGQNNMFSKELYASHEALCRCSFSGNALTNGPNVLFAFLCCLSN